MRRVCPHEFVSLIFILNMIGSGPRVTFSYDSVNSTRLRTMIVISSVMALMMALLMLPMPAWMMVSMMILMIIMYAYVCV